MDARRYAIDLKTDAAQGRHGTDGESASRTRDWVLLAAIVLVAIDLRPGIVSIGPVLPLIQREFGLSHASASLLTTIPDLLMGLLALPTPWLARRFGRNGVLLASLVLLCAAMLARAFASDAAGLLLSTAGVGAGIAVAGALFAGLIKTRFPTRVATLMGIYATALSLGSTVSAAATGTISVHMGHDWRFASGVWSVLGLIAVAAWITVMIVERKIIGNGSVSRTNSAVLPIRNGKAWLVALFFACDNFLFYALLSWTAPMYQEHGFPTTKAGFLLASYTLAFMCACPVFGSLSKSHDRRMWLAACALLTGAGLIGLAFAPLLAPFLWVPLAAIGLGGGFTLGMTLPLDNTHTADETNTWNAFTMTVGYLIAALGPFLVGALRDVTGSFRISTIVLVAVSVVMLAFTPFLKPAPNGSQLAVD